MGERKGIDQFIYKSAGERERERGRKKVKSGGVVSVEAEVKRLFI